MVPVHDDRVRPYRAIPIFHPDTIVQHYLRPEEMKPFYVEARRAAASASAGAQAPEGEAGALSLPAFPSDGTNSVPSSVAGASDAGLAPAQLYATLVEMGVLRR